MDDNGDIEKKFINKNNSKMLLRFILVLLKKLSDIHLQRKLI